MQRKVIDFLLFYVNGQKVIEYQVEPEWTLLWYLRNSKNHNNELLTMLMPVCFCSSRNRIEINWIKIRLR